MSSLPGMLGDVHFGFVGNPLPDWREGEIENDEDPDDEELTVSDPGLVAILGIDPRDIDFGDEGDGDDGDDEA